MNTVFFSTYLISLIVGGFFVVASAFLGGHDFDGDADADLHIDADLHADADLHIDADLHADADLHIDADADLHIDGDSSFDFMPYFMPFLSFKFWTFGLSTFGSTGLLLNYLKKGEPISFILSLSLGFIIGYTVATLIRKIEKASKEAQTTIKDYIGQIATVTVPFNSSEKGKIEMHVKDRMIPMLARTEEGIEFDLGEKCIILEIKENYCVVMPIKDEKYLN